MQETAVERLSDDAKADIQGFVTSGFGHLRHTAYLCFEITDVSAGRKWLAGIVRRVTTAKGWRSAPEGSKRKPEATVNLAFTWNGLAALGVSDAALCSFPRAFREGMADPARAASVLGDIGDSAPDRWLFGGPANTPIHAVLILHALTEQQLEDLVADLRDPTGGAIEIEAASQRGYRREDNKEHFGFRDGIAQPRIAGIKGQLAPNILPTGNFILGYPDHYKFVAQGPGRSRCRRPRRHLAPLSRTRTFRAETSATWDATAPMSSFGNSNRMWRVSGTSCWRRRSGPGMPANSASPGSLRISWGRWPSGAPLVLRPHNDDSSLATHDEFSYAQLDPNGVRCPFGSHIRRTNPRDVIRPSGTEQSTNMSNAHRILRHGSIFGPPLFDLSTLDGLGDEDSLPFGEPRDDGRSRGLHFLCINAGIERQFELIQQQWVNNPAFNGLVANQDPLIGENRRDTPQPSRMTIEGNGGWRTEPVPRFVKTVGGAYLFMPGMRTLRFLATNRR